MDVYKKLEELGVSLLGPTPKGGIYSSIQPYGDHLLYVSGTAPHNSVDENMCGKLDQSIPSQKARRLPEDVW